MRKITQRPHLARTAAALAVAATAVVLPWTITTAHAAVTPQAAAPPGVVKLADSEACPPATLCLYRDYRRRGPAYGIGAGYIINLSKLPLAGGQGGNNTAADNISSWVNNTASAARLTDTETGVTRTLNAGGSLEEPSANNDTVDVVSWAP